MNNPFTNPLTGEELKDWVWYHTKNHTRFSGAAAGLKEVFNLPNEKLYMLQKHGNEIRTIEVKGSDRK